MQTLPSRVHVHLHPPRQGRVRRPLTHALLRASGVRPLASVRPRPRASANERNHCCGFQRAPPPGEAALTLSRQSMKAAPPFSGARAASLKRLPLHGTTHERSVQRAAP